MTVSLTVKDIDYGKGSERFVNLKSSVPEGEEGLVEYDEVVALMLDLQLEAWKGIQGARYAGGEIAARKFPELIAQAENRVKKVKQFLKGELDVTNSE
jgi:hypothetical protein